jgi:hypothetical protein
LLAVVAALTGVDLLAVAQTITMNVVVMLAWPQVVQVVLMALQVITVPTMVAMAMAQILHMVLAALLEVGTQVIMGILLQAQVLVVAVVAITQAVALVHLDLLQWSIKGIHD